MIEVGAATRVINNEIGTDIQGASVNKCVRCIRDDLEANALFLKRDEESLLLVSCDVAGLESEFVSSFREKMAGAAQIAAMPPARNIIIAGTHTHSGPSLIPTNYLKPVDTDYVGRLEGWLVELAREAVGTARPARLGWGLGTARIGYNRRVCWADGRHTMHGDTNRPDCIGLEGPDDPSHLALFAEDQAKTPIAVFYNNTAHPTCFYGADFLSADFPGAARKYLREVLGEIPVLFFNGAFGDISISSQSAFRPEDAERKMLRAAHLVAGETLRLLHEATFHDDAVLKHVFEEISIPVRLPTAERLAAAKAVLARVDGGEKVDPWQIMLAHAPVLLQERFGNDPTDVLPVHAVRIGEVALATQPCELFCQFGLEIKRRSPSALTAVCGIADGCGGYCPTMAAVMGGGYSGEAFYWSRLVPEAGNMIVDSASKLLGTLWQKSRTDRSRTDRS